MTKIDRAALELAMEIARQDQGDPGRGKQLDEKLEDESWEAVAQFAPTAAKFGRCD